MVWKSESYFFPFGFGHTSSPVTPLHVPPSSILRHESRTASCALGTTVDRELVMFLRAFLFARNSSNKQTIFHRFRQCTSRQSSCQTSWHHASYAQSWYLHSCQSFFPVCRGIHTWRTAWSLLHSWAEGAGGGGDHSNVRSCWPVRALRCLVAPPATTAAVPTKRPLRISTVGNHVNTLTLLLRPSFPF